ncbi:alpha/beta hydrolase [Microbacterium capsulatum]|uniref:Alpha/beta hydrolase n=1 Tax=Microbacterium capsulatum TaxID=3041921 RepID=A0ABU0XH03_9MICO|nr:alpha/beta hydrolase [Microbacterium sp. ASV81]MDQ4214396.1 alpha/beta hydrolase [Microbacterium sp. ASV81]
MKKLTAPRLRRVSAVLAGLAVAAVALSGCLYSMIPAGTSASSSPNAPDTAGVSAALKPFYGQTLSWSSCGTGMDCTTVKAPLDWTDPAKGRIDLAVIRHRATGTAKGSLLTNPGGPGASGVDLIKSNLSFAVSPTLIKNYDVIGFDPRGVGSSTAVKCFAAPQMDAYLYSIPPGTRGSDQWNAALGAANKRFADACAQNSGGILPYITTVNSARDMDLLRAVLGDKKLNYLGYSYGTFLGATYAGLYPDRVGQVVLDGALDPAVSSLDVSTTQAVGFESALKAYMADCLKGKKCPFQGSVDEAMSDLGALLASVDRTPQKNADGRLLGADTMMTSIVAALYSQDSWSYLSEALTGVLKGDPSVAFQLADFYNGREKGKYTDNSTEAFRAYNCMDYPLEKDKAVKDAAQAKINVLAPVVAPYWEGVDPCEQWPYPPTGTRGQITAPGSGPILVIGTTNDPATPYEWAVSLAKQLEGGVLITRVGEGHTGYNKGNNCVDSAVDAYFVTNTVPDKAGIRCQ